MYGKIFESMYDGTLYGNWQAIVAFQQMIVLADADGVVDMTPQAIAARTSIPLDIIRPGIELLEQPDPFSRSTSEQGRRIKRLQAHRPWGWRIVNYGYYRDLFSREEKRRKDRERIAGKRDIERQDATGGDNQSDVADSRGESGDVADVAHADTDAHSDADASPKKENPPTPQRGVPASPAGLDPALAVNRIFDHWRTVHGHPKAVLDKKRRGLINAALKNYDEQTLKDCISGYRNSPHHQGVNERNTAYDTIDLILKDSKHIDMGLKFFAAPRTKSAPAKSSLELEWERVRTQAKLEGFREPRDDEPLKDFEAELAKHSHRVAVDRMKALAGAGDALKSMGGA